MLLANERRRKKVVKKNVLYFINLLYLFLLGARSADNNTYIYLLPLKLVLDPLILQ